MATSLLRSGDHITYINTNMANRPGEAIIFVNGIYNSRGEAEEGARKISSTINNSRVGLFYNPTANTKGTGNVAVGAESNRSLSGALSALILQEISICEQNAQSQTSQRVESIRILILAHSHGAILTRLALENPSIGPSNGKLEVAAFGGATLIPFGLAKKVQNFMNEKDFIPLLAMKQAPSSDASGLQGFLENSIPEFQRIVVHDLLGSSAYKEQHFSERIDSALKTHKLIQEGNSPLQAQLINLFQTFADVMEKANQSNGTEEQKINKGVLAALRAFIIEIGFPMEILVPTHLPANDAFHHPLHTYLPKITWVINNPPKLLVASKRTRQQKV
jgi:hypothetical protein